MYHQCIACATVTRSTLASGRPLASDGATSKCTPAIEGAAATCCAVEFSTWWTIHVIGQFTDVPQSLKHAARNEDLLRRRVLGMDRAVLLR